MVIPDSIIPFLLMSPGARRGAMFMKRLLEVRPDVLDFIRTDLLGVSYRYIFSNDWAGWLVAKGWVEGWGGPPYHLLCQCKSLNMLWAYHLYRDNFDTDDFDVKEFVIILRLRCRLLPEH